MTVTIWRDEANMRTCVRTSQGVMLNERGQPADIGPTHQEGSRWHRVEDVAEHFRRVDEILRSL